MATTETILSCHPGEKCIIHNFSISSPAAEEKKLIVHPLLLTPFSAVAPPLSLTLTTRLIRIRVESALETILEEEEEEDEEEADMDDDDDVLPLLLTNATDDDNKTKSLSPAAVMMLPTKTKAPSSSTCFWQVRRQPGSSSSSFSLSWGFA
ncbi:unnamed protein product [Linum trigynum]|uniref:Uncharacterized protein n=1 Tax=Linum trigynum TaxID=586398 RepID=A0AAV2FXM6_9ROSI